MRHKRPSPIALLAALVLAGCGNSSGDLDFTSGQSGGASTPRTTVHGQAHLDVPFENAAVSFFTVDGGQIPTAGPVVTDASGNFEAQLLDSPPAFRAVATGANEAYSAEVDNFNAGDELLIITPLTHIAASYHQAHPELTLAQAEQAVRDYLELPEGHDLDTHLVLHGHRPGFHVGKYLAAARSWSVMGQSTDTTTFTAQLNQSIDDVRNGVKAPTINNNIFSGDSSRFWINQSIQLGVSVVTVVLQANKIPFGPLLGWTVTFALTVTGQTAEQKEYEALAVEIAAVAGLIEDVYRALNEAIKGTAYFLSLNAQAKDLGSIQSSREEFAALVKGGSSTPEDLRNFAQDVTAKAFVDLLDQTHLAQMGVSNGLIDQTAQIAKVDGVYYTNKHQFVPMRSEFDYFAGFQTSAIMLIVEGYHALDLPNMAEPARLYAKYQSNLATQASKLPQALDSDKVIYARPAGKVYLLEVQAGALYETASARAKVFKEGKYRNWRVASHQDIKDLFSPEREGNHRKLSDLETLGLVDKNIKRFEGENLIGVSDSDWNKRVISIDDPFNPDYGIFPAWEGDEKPGGAYPYMLVCDAKDQDPSVLAPLTRVEHITVSREGNQMHAVAEVSGSSGDYKSKAFERFKSQIDITKLVSWSSSDEQLVRIGNSPITTKDVKKINQTYKDSQDQFTPLVALPPSVVFEPGGLTWLGKGTAKVTASIFDPFQPGSDPKVSTVSIADKTIAAPTPLQVQLYPHHPRNITALDHKTELRVEVFYSDGSIRSVFDGLTFTSSAPEASVTVLNSQIELGLSAKPAASSFQVTVTYEGKSDTVTFFQDI